jgi:hypothetical protein
MGEPSCGTHTVAAPAGTAIRLRVHQLMRTGRDRRKSAHSCNKTRHPPPAFGCAPNPPNPWRTAYAGVRSRQLTVSKYMIRHRGPPSQTWRTFLRNHADAIAAIDLCVVPTLTFVCWFAFLVVGHSRRHLLWFAKAFPWPDRYTPARLLGSCPELRRIRLRARLRGHRIGARRLALPLRAGGVLGEGQEPGCTGGTTRIPRMGRAVMIPRGRYRPPAWPAACLGFSVTCRYR